MLQKEELKIFIDTIKERSEYDFTDYSEKSFSRRVEKIMTDYCLDFPELIRNIKTNKEFIEKIVKDITVNTTELFRDVKVWQDIKHRILPKFKEKKEFDVWHAGCSTGQEIYSLNILLNELGICEKANISATDINPDVIKKAEQGVYPYTFNIEYLDNFEQVVRKNPYNFDQYIDVPYSKYFLIDSEADTISMNSFLKKNIEYKKHNLVTKTSAFNKKFDIIFCRNVLIYFNIKLQQDLFYLFYNCLKPNGYLILGASESMIDERVIGYKRLGTFYTKI